MKTPALPALLALVTGLFVALPALDANGVPAKGTNEGRVRLGMLRAVPAKWELDENFALFLRAIAMAAEQKVQILITPEGWLDGYASTAQDSTPEKIRGIAQDLDTSPYLQRVAEEARRHGMFICFGFTSLENGKPYNAAGLWDAQGNRVGVYHKTHLQRHDLQYTPGESLPVWPTPWGEVGIMICADRRWPETARTLRLKGAKLILNPTYGFYNDLNEAMMRTRSYENQCFIAFAHPKQSLVTAPNGRVIAKEDAKDSEAGEPHLLVCTLDLTLARDDNHLPDRRPEIYRIITETK